MFRAFPFALALAIATLAQFALANTAHAQMSGTYTINQASATTYPGGTHFNTIGEAFDALENDGVSAAVTFNVFDDGGDYISNLDYGLGVDDIGIFDAPVSGMGAHAITFRAAPGEFPVVSGSAYITTLADDVTCYINSPDNLTIEGITFTGGQSACLLIAAQYAPSTAPTNLTISRCTFSNCSGGAGLLVQGGGGQLTNVTIENNFFFGNAGHGGPGLAPSAARASLGLTSVSSSVDVHHNTILHTSTTATTGAIGMSDSSNGIGDMSYNIFIVTGSGRYCINDHSAGLPPTSGNHNVYYYPNGLIHRNTPLYPDLATWQSSTGLDANSVNTNPNLNNITSGSENLHLTINSENCVEKAIGSTATIDRDGDSRPFGGNRDIGADETTISVPEIDVQRPAGTSITDGGSDTFPSALVAGVVLPVTYTIASLGNAAVTVSTPTFSSQSNVNVTVGTAPPGSVASGSTATFVLDIQPIQAGAWSFNFSMANNDGNENPYNFTVSGTADGPEIDVERPIGTTVPDGGTDNVGGGFGTLVASDITYRIDNAVGNQNLTLGSVTVTPVSACTVIVQTAPSSPVSVGGNTNLIVRVTPTASGSFSFTVSIPNNDGNEDPYNFTVNGTSSPTAAEIQIERPLSTVVNDGGLDPLGSLPAGTPTVLTYTILNLGGTTLNITSIPITVTPTSNCTASCTSQPAATIAPASSTTFDITVTPTGAGSFSYIVIIANDDANENPYNFSANGNATAAEMDLSRSGVPKSDGGTDNVGNMTAGFATSVTYTIQNSGAANLTLVTPITVTPVTNCGVTVTTQPSSPVLPSNTTTFTLAVTPTAAGPFQFTMSIGNNDANENPYDLTVNGTGLAPEIDVQRPAGISITDGGSDNVGTIATGTPTGITWFIVNQGNQILSITTPVTVSPVSNCTVNVSTQPSGSVGPSSSTVMIINITPTNPGAFQFTIAITNSDPNEDPYNITVNGSGAAAPAEIDVQRPAGTSIPDGGTDTLPGTYLAGSPSAITYTIENTGGTALGVTTPISASAGSNCNVTVSQQPSTSIAPSGTTPFQITVTPTNAGAFSFNVSISNTDANENPYNFTVNGTGVAPDIDLQRPAGTSKPDGGSDNIGNLVAGAATLFTYTIANTGSAALTISLPVNVTPVSNCSVSIGSSPATSVPASNSTTFSVNVTPTSAGSFSFNLSIDNDDPDEDPYNITVSGTGVVPDMDLQRPAGTSKADGGTDNLGNVTAGSPTVFTYTIANAGGANLTISLPVNVAPVSNCSVSIGSPPGTTVAPSASTTFTVNVTPTAFGAFSFTLSIDNNDPDEDPYNITVNGTGQSPEIDVQRPLGTSIADGGTDNIGTIPTAAASSRTWFIVNQGNQALSVTTPVSVSPVSNCTVNVTTQPPTSIAASANGSLIVDITPTIAGAFSFTITINNGDLDEDPYNITVNGTGASTPAEIDVQRPALTSIPDGGTDTLPGTFIAGSPSPVTYTIENQGGSALSVTVPVTVTAGSNCSVSVTTQPATSVPALSTTTFVVSVTATAAGSFDFSVSFANGDSNENPYNFTVNGTGVAPDMDLQRPAGTSKTDGGTDALGGVIAGQPTVFTYTIENTGGATLTVSTPVNVTPISNCTVSVGTQPGTTITAGNTTTFTVSVTPTAAGAFSFTLSIDNNDPDENPYNITVSGTGTSPEMGVERPSGSGIPVSSTDNLGNVPAGTVTQFTYTIRNTGTAPLTLVLPVTVTAGSNCAVSVSTQPTSPVPTSSTTTFVVDVTPAAGGVFDFNVSIINNDLDENPYTFTVTGTGTVVPPEIDIQRPVGTSIPDGGADAVGSRLAGSATTLTYTIANTGGSALNLTLPVTAVGGANCSASVTAPPTTPVPAGGSTTFQVTFTPTAAAAFDYNVVVINDDPNEGTYDFTASGTGFISGPEMEIQRPAGTPIADGGTDTLPNVTAGTTTDFTYVIENFGNADLTMTTPITVTATGNCTAAATVQPQTPVAAGNMTTFTVQVTANGLGAFSYTVSITNNDADENPYNFTASGTADAPEIEVQRPVGTPITSGGGDALGTVSFGSNINITYTVENQGTLPLAITTPISATANSNCTVSVSTQPATSVAAGGSTTFVVVLNVGVAGAFSYDVAITNNDSDENPYTFTATGTGATVPEIDIQRPAGVSIASGGTDDVGNVGVVGTTTLVYVIANQGGAALDLTGTPLVSIQNTFNCVVTVTSDPVTPVAAAGVTVFVIDVTAVSVGAVSFEIIVDNNDADEGTYTINVVGNGGGTGSSGGGGGGCAIIGTGDGADALPLWLLLAGLAAFVAGYRRARG